MRRHRWWVVAPVAVALALGPAGCGGDEPIETAQDGGAAGPVTAADALDGAPLAQPLGSPVATDATSLWYSDFDRLARRDLATGRWDVRDLPFDGEVSALAFVPDGAGGLTGLAGLCQAEGCDEGTIGEVAAWRVALDGEPERVALDGPVPLSATSAGDVHLTPVVAGAAAVFRVADGRGTILVRWADAPRVEAVDRAVTTLCPAGGGFVGIEDDAGSGRPLAPRTVVAGSDLGDLAPVGTEPAVDRLLAGADGAASCLADGLAVVGPDEAWELRGGRWRAVPSDVGAPLRRQLPVGLPVVDGTGTLVQAGTVLDLSRDETGWHAPAGLARPAAYGLVGGEVLAYPSDP